MELAPGTMVTPNVRLTRRLGEGSMGSVWVAEHLRLRLDVAVKFISGKLATDDPEVLARFEQEASLAARIKSDHVVQTHDCGLMEDGTPYIVMELLEGENLGERLAREGTLSVADLGRVVAQVAMALGRAHRLGVVHRDIKPDNIYLCSMGEGLHAKVLDFGVAKPVRPPSEQGPEADAGAGADSPEAMAGTMQFLSPEQFKGEETVDFHADLWALAVVAYRCLTGELPFNGLTPGLLCVSVLTGQFRLPSACREDLPAGLDEWFARAFHKELPERFSSAKEMALALAALIPATDLGASAVVDGGIPLGLTSPGGRLGHKGMSRPVLGGIAAAIVLAAVIGGVMLAGGSSSQSTAGDSAAEQSAAPAESAEAPDSGEAEEADGDGGSSAEPMASTRPTAVSPPAAKRATVPPPSKPPPKPPEPATTREDYGF